MNEQEFLDYVGLQVVVNKLMEKINQTTNSPFSFVLNEEDGSVSLVYNDTNS